jgi:acetyl-CoA carboxylase biotin carboxyl carrier protein
MTVNHNLSPNEEPIIQPGVSPNRVRVHMAGVTLDIELNREHGGDARVSTLAPVAAPAIPVQAGPAPAPAPEPEPNPDLHYVRAPMVGTFYRCPEPGSPPFVSVGDLVCAGQQVGIVEAMKLMNRIDADSAGRVTEILVPDATSVEYDQPMIAVVPD